MPGLFEFALTAFTTLFVVVDPFGLGPLFIALTESKSDLERQALLRRAIVVASGITLAFLFTGNAVLRYMGVTIHAFSISGGVLLFFTALPMLFGQRPSLQAPDDEESTEAGADVAIFPIAIPLMAGPGTLTAILLLAAKAQGEGSHPLITQTVWLRMSVLALTLVAVFLSSYVILRISERMLQRVGTGGIHIITRVMGVLLAALAVQFVLNGVSGFVHAF